MNFVWQFPTRIVFGCGTFASAHKHLRGLGKRALVMTSPSFTKARKPLLDELLSQLKKIDVEYEIFSEVEPNPRDTTVDRAGAVVREFKPRYIIAFGGGSVMDAAKGAAVLGENPGRIYEYAYLGPKLEAPKMRPFNSALPVVCIPTVAATSSETSLYSVITNDSTKRKVSINNEAIIPKLSIIDPELTYSIGPMQTVDGAFDMITHVIETYLSTPQPAPIQDNLTEAIIATVVESLPKALENPKDALARSQLSWCGALALSGVLSGRDGGWPIHALEHGLSAYTDVAHGRGLAMLLPHVIKYDAPAIPAKIARFEKKIFGAHGGLEKYMKEVGAWTNLESIAGGMPVNELVDKTIEHALEIKGVWKQGQEPYLDNCRPLYRKDLEEILRATEASR